MSNKESPGGQGLWRWASSGDSLRSWRDLPERSRGLLVLRENDVDVSISGHRDRDPAVRIQTKQFRIACVADVLRDPLSQKILFGEGRAGVVTHKHSGDRTDSRCSPYSEVSSGVLAGNGAFDWPHVQIFADSVDLLLRTVRQLDFVKLHSYIS